MKRNLDLLTTPAFLVALALLLVNDFALKSAFHNALTGKLSDFAGLFAFALFWMSLFPARRRLICVTVAVAFAIWKSAWSQSLIGAWNTLPLFDIGRTIDYTDLIALCVLPLAALYSEAKPRAFVSFRFAPHAVAAVAVFAFTATQAPDIHRAEADRAITFNFPREELLARLNRVPNVRANFFGGVSNQQHDSLHIVYDFRFCDDDSLEAYALVHDTGDGRVSLQNLRIEYLCMNAEDDYNQEVLNIFERDVFARVDETQFRQRPSPMPSATTMPMLPASPEN